MGLPSEPSDPATKKGTHFAARTVGSIFNKRGPLWPGRNQSWLKACLNCPSPRTKKPTFSRSCIIPYVGAALFITLMVLQHILDLQKKESMVSCIVPHAAAHLWVVRSYLPFSQPHFICDTLLTLHQATLLRGVKLVFMQKQKVSTNSTPPPTSILPLLTSSISCLSSLVSLAQGSVLALEQHRRC